MKFLSRSRGDFADNLAADWPGARLALEENGRELSVGIVVLDFPTVQVRPRIHVVADFRPDLARVPAPLRGSGGTHRTRPATY